MGGGGGGETYWLKTVLNGQLMCQVASLILISKPDTYGVIFIQVVGTGQKYCGHILMANPFIMAWNEVLVAYVSCSFEGNYG